MGKSALTFKFTETVLPPGPQGPVILNSASLVPGIAPGGLVTFIGLGLAPTIDGVVTDPSQMQGYSVSFDGIPAPILALVNQNGTQQINAQVPFEESPGPTDTVSIETPQGSETLSNITVSLFAPGIFTNGSLISFGQNYALAVVVRSDGSLVSPSIRPIAAKTSRFTPLDWVRRCLWHPPVCRANPASWWARLYMPA